MNPRAIALSTPRIASVMRLGSASARARAPSRSLSARSQASVEKEHFLVGALKRRPRPRKKRSELIRETSAPLWGQNVRQLRQTPMNKSDHNGYWAALERSKLVRLGVRNRSQ